jgi:beta-aspartyl-peptidase (threonine type)
VVAAVRELERCPEFNAGRGGALDRDGAVALDAMVMEGSARRAGGVIGVARTLHPIDAALAVLRDGRHVLLAGEGAERFAREAGLAVVDPAYHLTEERRAQLAHVLAGRAPGGGTVGAVARDAAGHLAAATSTGGLTGRLPGRVSDSALPGSGTWADDATCAVSATGLGDFFIRAGFARDVDARMRYGGRDLDTACAEALAAVAALGGIGGCIAIDAQGRIAMRFDTPDMPRGARVGSQPPRIALRGADLLV